MPHATYILGISAYYHDSAAALLRDGKIVAAGQEERFTRIKGDASFPVNAIKFCLEHEGISIADVDHVGFYDKPLLKFERILETYLSIAPAGFRSFLKAGPLWAKEKLFQKDDILKKLDYHGEILFAEHHESHAASAFLPSPFEEAAILTMDAVGEWATASIGVGRGNDLELTHELRWPDSLGIVYSAFTSYMGFKVNSGEHKVMGLAPYGEPKYLDMILGELMNLREDGSFTLDQKYFNYLGGLTMTSPAFDELFGGPAREPESTVTRREMDLARSVQEACEEVVMRMVNTAHQETGLTNLCLAGGVALNCVANGRILREGPFEKLWIQPAASDAGGALGVAQLIWYRHLGRPRKPNGHRDAMHGAYLGPSFSPERIAETLDQFGAVYERPDRSELIDTAAKLLGDANVVGWFNGRMEFGPRALGSRSIVGDPRSPEMQTRMNLKIKFRESFRPFAPSILEHRASDYFELDTESPYMLFVSPVQEDRRIPMTREHEALFGIEKLNVPRSDVPAITHVDYSARVQTVSKEISPDYFDLISKFEEHTGCPLVVNTSFNVRGEPIVCTPEDAYICFMRTDMDYLVLGPYLLDKREQPELVAEGGWRDDFELD